MGAECRKHGVDLHGDTFSGLTCPVCEIEAERDRYRDALERVVRDIGPNLPEDVGNLSSISFHAQALVRLIDAVGHARSVVYLDREARS